MSTVIDSLLIELGLDASKFNAGQKKSVEELRKFDEQAQKTAKNTQEGAKNTAEGFEKARNALISFGVAAFGAKGFSQFVSTMTNTNAALGRTANLLGLSARELDAWGGVLKSVGGDANSFQTSIQAIQSGLAGIKLGDSAILTPLARLGALGAVDLEKNSVDIYKLADALKRFRDANGEQLTYTLAQQLGLNKETFLVLEQGSSVVHKLYDENYKLSGISEKNTEAAQKLQAQWGLLSQSFSGAKNSIMDELYPALGVLAEGTTLGLNKFVEWDKNANGLISDIGLIAAGIVSLNSALKLVGVTLGTGVISKFFGAAGLLFHSENLNSNEAEELKKRQAMPWTGGSSTSASASNLPRNLRNNNPGNIEYGPFAKAHGATGSDGRFAIFPDMATGQNAMASLLMSYAKGGNNTISSIISKWSPAKDNGATNTSAYINDVAKRTGIDPNKPLTMGELAAVQQAMSNHEGMIGAKTNTPLGAGSNTNVQTSIGTINVQTQATDSNGIANSLGKSIQNNSLINYGIIGNR